MKTAKIISVYAIVASTIFLLCSFAFAEEFRIAIMQDERGAAANFRPLETYLKHKGINFSFIGANNYPAAAKMFVSGEVDAMFSGSGIAGIFIMKDLASPLVRPVSKEGYSTYHADIIAKSGSPKFDGSADYFKGKRVIFTPLASSGEIFYRSVPNLKSVNVALMKAASHGAAIEALANGGADVAIVKNHVWDKLKGKYPKLMKVGEDTEENPDGTLIVSRKADAKITSKVSALLIALADDKTPEAKAAREALGIKGYIKTTNTDFKHTLELLKNAGVDRSFEFEFK